jgi:hypothetical protein
MSTRMSSAPSIAQVRTAVRTSLSLTFGLGMRKPVTNGRSCRMLRESCSNLTRNLKSANAAQVLLSHVCWQKHINQRSCLPIVRQLLNVLLWKITEAESSKCKTRFQSQGALPSRNGKLRHDHVFQLSKMIARPEKAAPQRYRLSSAPNQRPTATRLWRPPLSA